MQRFGTSERILLFVVPWDSNPYQELLYRPMRSTSPRRLETLYWKRRPWIGIPHFFLLALWAAVRGSRLVHVHWLAWDVRIAMPLRKQISGAISRAAIWWLRTLRFQIVWTVHNVIPHEEGTDDDLRIGRLLASSAERIIVHSEVILESLRGLGFSTDVAVVIPQGSYVGLYGPSPSRTVARDKLDLHNPGRVLLFFGLIRPYKGIPDLLAAWANTAFGGTLLIVGSCPNDELAKQIRAAADEDPSIDARLGFIPDEQVALYFASAEGICLPFRQITTSSSALLALSLGTPLIAPRLGALEDLPDNVGFFYGGETGRTLADGLQRFFAASETDLGARAVNGSIFAESLSWSSIAEQTLAQFTTLLERRYNDN